MAFTNPLRSLSADDITPGTLSGSIVETGPTGRRIVLDPNQLATLLYSGATAETSPGGLYASVSTGVHPLPFVELDAPSIQPDGGESAWLSLISGGGPSNDQGSFELSTGYGSGGRSTVYAYASDGGANLGEIDLQVYDPVLGTSYLQVSSNLLEWVPQTGPGWYANTTGVTLGGALHVLGAVTVDTTVSATGETWHAPTLGTGWATGPTSGSVQPFQFRKGVGDQVWVEGLFHSTSASPAATVCTLPSAYWPKKTKRIPVALNSSNTITSALLQITTAGVVSLVPAVAAASVDVQVNSYFSLGNLA